MMETLWCVDVSQLGASQRLNIYYFGPIRLDAIDLASQRYLRSWKWKNGKGMNEHHGMLSDDYFHSPGS